MKGPSYGLYIFRELGLSPHTLVPWPWQEASVSLSSKFGPVLDSVIQDPMRVSK